MQTFLPYPDFQQSAQILDYRRLGKQRLEAHQIIQILLYKKSTGWSNHPAVKMWKDYEDSLCGYYNEILTEWILRGYKNNMSPIITNNKIINPWWLGNENFHRAMRSRLIEKNPEYYLPKFPNDKEFNNSKYLWPNNQTKTFKII